jgi:CheY-like chemotaxis protein
MPTILIADDDPTLRAVAREMLAGAHYRILEAADGDEALQIIRSTDVDLVVLDMLMPNKDGLETLMALREENRPALVLAISSGGQMESGSLLRIAAAFGATETLAKPLRLDTFVPTIERILLARASVAHRPD